MLDKTSETEDVSAMMADIGKRARSAAHQLAIANGETKSTALKSAAKAIDGHRNAVLGANALDMRNGETSGAITMIPASIKIFATSAMRRMFSVRPASLKPRSLCKP